MASSTTSFQLILSITLLYCGPSIDGAVVKQNLPVRIEEWEAEKGADPPIGENWTLIQHWRIGQSDAFKNNGWMQYRSGFGARDKTGPDYWLGLENMRRLTATGSWQLFVGLRSPSSETNANDWSYVIYNDFKIGDEIKGYPLHVGSEAESFEMKHAGKKMLFEYSSGNPFSTKDKDNDRLNAHCARNYEGGWWFNKCFNLCLTCKHVYGTGGDQGIRFFQTYMAIRMVQGN